MDESEQQFYCTHCWNPVEKIKYREGGIALRGDVKNEWKHSGGGMYTRCNTSPITDEDVTDQEK